MVKRRILTSPLIQDYSLINNYTGMKRLLFLLAILMASLPSWAAEEEIFFNFKQTTTNNASLNKNGNVISNAYYGFVKGNRSFAGSDAAQKYNDSYSLVGSSYTYPALDYIAFYEQAGSTKSPVTDKEVLKLDASPNRANVAQHFILASSYHGMLLHWYTKAGPTTRQTKISWTISSDQPIAQPTPTFSLRPQ